MARHVGAVKAFVSENSCRSAQQVASLRSSPTGQSFLSARKNRFSLIVIGSGSMDPEKLEKYANIADKLIVSSQAEYAGHAKWILASLLAINGGGLVAMVQLAASVPKLTMTFAPLLFALGCLLAIASGYASQKRTLEVSATFLKFLIAEDDDERSRVLHDGAASERWFERLAEVAVLVSAIAFCAGAAFLWMAIKSSVIAN